MKRAALLLACAGCKADLPPLTDANRTLDTVCRGPYADTLVDTTPANLAGAASALGAPDGTAVSLMANNVLTVGFVGLGAITDASGADLKIDAMVPTGGHAIVRVASTNMQFVYAGELTPSTSMFDLQVAMLPGATYVRIVDVAGTIAIDAVEAVHDKCK